MTVSYPTPTGRAIGRVLSFADEGRIALVLLADGRSRTWLSLRYLRAV